MCPVSTVRPSSATIIEKKTDKKPVVTTVSDSAVIEKPIVVTPPKDKNLSKTTLPDDFKKQVSFKGKIDPKPTHKKEEHHSTADDIKHIAHDAHHTKYEIAVSAQKLVSKTSNAIIKGSRVLLVSGEIGQVQKRLKQ